MDDLSTVLCLCPTSRLSVVSLVLSTWREVRRCIIAEREPAAAELDGVTAIVVMDRFVTRATVERLVALRPVIVLAWNGLFEIIRYKEELGELPVRYMGPEETLDAGVPYQPFIDGACGFRTWMTRYETRAMFEIRGSREYKLRWLRTRVMGRRLVSVGVAALGAVRRPLALRRTLQSAVAKDKLVWAGVCFIEPSVGLTVAEEAEIRATLADIRALPDPDARLAASLAAVANWRARSTPETAHQVFYVVNTLVRWGVIDYLASSAKDATWFFGRDNLGLGLEVELYVHNLVPSERIAFLELGGTKTGDTLYPRALHLLARKFYVISVPADGTGDVSTMLGRLRRDLTSRRHELFDEIEARRQALYGSIDATATLANVHGRVWHDFTR